MHCLIFLCVGFWAADVAEYSRSLSSKKLDQPTLEAESYGKKEAFERTERGLRIKVSPGDPESGWKTPQVLRIGGDFTITANIVLGKLPKPAQDDGGAVGIAIATQSIDQPDATLLRLVEMDGREVYRTINQVKNVGQDQQAMMLQQQRVAMAAMAGVQPGGKPPKPPRPTFPAKGEALRFELRRTGSTVEYQVLDAESNELRYLGQVAVGAGDLVGVKLFASNRNGADAFEVVLGDLLIRSARIGGLGTEVRSSFGEVIYGDPNAVDAGTLVVGEAPAAPANAAPNAGSQAPSAAPAAGPIAEVPKGAMPAGAVVAAAPVGPQVVVVAAPVAAGRVAVAAQPSAAVDASAGARPATAAQAAAAANAAAATPAQAPKPKVRLPLDEVESIVFDRALTIAGRYVGQPNVDVTGPVGAKAVAAPQKPGAEAKSADAKPVDTAPPAAKVAAAQPDDVVAPPPGTVVAVKVPKVDPKPNGIRDLRFTLSGLRNAAIQQLVVNGQTDKGATIWQLDTTGTTNSPLVVERAGTESWADLFLEPPPGDAHDKTFTLNITFADGQQANAQIKVDKHTDPKLAFDAAAPAATPDVRIYLAEDEQLFGKLTGMDEQTIRLTTPWGDSLRIPISRVIGLYMGLSDHKESSTSFLKRLKSRGTEDLLLARSKEGEVVTIAGVAEGTKDDKLLFHFQEKQRSLPLKQVEGLVLAARPDPKPTDELRAVFRLGGGLTISGEWLGLDAKTWKVRTPWGEILNLPAAELLSVRFRGGQMSYLSDRNPSNVEETPYFGRQAPYRRDVNLLGEPLRIDGQTYARGIAVHSRCVLTYELGGRYVLFETQVGFDDSARDKGRVDCRVLADGKELYANPDLRATAPAVPLSLPVARVQRLELIVDFGADEDTGDHVIWANPRLYRRATPTPIKVEPAPAPKPDPKPATSDPKPDSKPNSTPPADPAPAPAPKPAEAGSQPAAKSSN
jgi:hypothetical protein